MSVVVVIVTYGARTKLLKLVLDSIVSDVAVQNIVVVSNGAAADSIALVKSTPKTQLVVLEGNTGSANGYSVGITTALDKGAERIMLLDDDNAPAPDAVTRLNEVLDEKAQRYGFDHVAVLAARRSGDLLHRYPRSSSFMGLNLASICSKLRHMLFLAEKPPAQECIEVPYGPFGGLFAHRTLYESIGLPNREFVVYADDIEYTSRIAKAGGKLTLVLPAKIIDVESSWQVVRRVPGALAAVLEPAPFRVYYTVRNHVWTGRHLLYKSALMYAINKIVYIAIILTLCLIFFRFRRMRLIVRAISDGERGRLGLCDDYPLPYAAGTRVRMASGDLTG